MMKLVKTYSQFLNEAKKQQFFTTKEEIEAWLVKQTDVTGYVINDDLTVDAKSVEIRRKMNYLPVRFGRVKNDFVIDSIGLKSLIGCPTYVGGDIICDHNKLTSLEGCPIEVGGTFSCSYNRLDTLKYCPTTIPDKFYIDGNQLTSCVFAPKKPEYYEGNPCSYIYYGLGFTTEAHVVALLKLDPNPADTLKDLKDVYPDRYKDILDKSKELRVIVGIEGEDLQKAYQTSVDVEGDFY